LQGDRTFQRLNRNSALTLKAHPLAALGTPGAGFRIITGAVSKKYRDQMPHQDPPFLTGLLFKLTQGGVWVVPFPLLQASVRSPCCLNEQLLLGIGRRRSHVQHLHQQVCDLLLPHLPPIRNLSGMHPPIIQQFQM